MVLKMSYGISEFADTTGFWQLNNADILSVDLVYSDYPSGQDLKDLNRKRYLSLLKLFPFLSGNKETTWQMIRQTNGKDKESSANLLHGFVINYRPPYTTTEADSEIAYIKKVTDELPKPPVEETKPGAKVRYWDVIYGKGDKIKKEPFDTAAMLKRNKALAPEWTDSTVFRITQRNHFKDALVVMDVTGSMSPYSAQVLGWLSAQDNVKFIACFNDGNNRAEYDKPLGNTGGIYGEPYQDLTQASKLITTTMSKGGGGMRPENDCEALLKAIELCQDCKDVVLIADSWAPVRDIDLVQQIKKPVKVVVCGGSVGVHTDYITIAAITHGSLYFRDGDLLDLSPLLHNQRLTIRGKDYYMVNGKAVALSQPTKP